MGLFDDILGIAKEFSGVKDEITSTLQQVVEEATSLKSEATGAVEQVIQGVSESGADIKNQITGAIGDSPISDALSPRQPE